jgi:hypothetical protein
MVAQLFASGSGTILYEFSTGARSMRRLKLSMTANT